MELSPDADRGRAPVAVLVPLHDEEESLPALERDLLAFLGEWHAERAVELVLVDDGSTDGTREAVAALAQRPGIQAAFHPENLGLTAALATGLAHTQAPIVCWLDADLTYEPALLRALVARVDGGAGVAVASPYHPRGRVEGVGRGRQVLSRGLSLLYRFFVDPRLHTFTSMVRAWRRETLEACRPRMGGFLGVAESLLRAVEAGAAVEEVPAVLRARTRGRSKLRVLPSVAGHLSLLARSVLGLLDDGGPSTTP